MEQFFGNINLGLVFAIIFCVYGLRSAITIPDKYVIFLPVGISIAISIVGYIFAGGQFDFNAAFINAMVAAYFFKVGKVLNPFSKNGKSGG